MTTLERPGIPRFSWYVGLLVVMWAVLLYAARRYGPPADAVAPDVGLPYDLRTNDRFQAAPDLAGHSLPDALTAKTPPPVVPPKNPPADPHAVFQELRLSGTYDLILSSRDTWLRREAAANAIHPGGATQEQLRAIQSSGSVPNY